MKQEYRGISDILNGMSGGTIHFGYWHNEEYRKLFGIYPFGHMELEYDQGDYGDYVRDIKRALETGKHLADFVE